MFFSLVFSFSLSFIRHIVVLCGGNQQITQELSFLGEDISPSQNVHPHGSPAHAPPKTIEEKLFGIMLVHTENIIKEI